MNLPAIPGWRVFQSREPDGAPGQWYATRIRRAPGAQTLHAATLDELAQRIAHENNRRLTATVLAERWAATARDIRRALRSHSPGPAASRLMLRVAGWEHGAAFLDDLAAKHGTTVADAAAQHLHDAAPEDLHRWCSDPSRPDTVLDVLLWTLRDVIPAPLMHQIADLTRSPR